MEVQIKKEIFTFEINTLTIPPEIPHSHKEEGNKKIFGVHYQKVCFTILIQLSIPSKIPD